MTPLGHRNPRIHDVRRLLGRRSSRREAGRFVVEGPTLAAEAVAGGWTCIEQYVPAGETDLAVDGAGPVFEVGDGVMEKISSTETPQSPVVVVEIPAAAPADQLRSSSLVVVADRLADPGNLGTILRSVEAAGADAVVLTPGSVDPYNPKVVRASAGAVFHVPVIECDVDDVADAGLRLVGTTSHDDHVRRPTGYSAADWSGRVAIVVGNEAAGLPAEWTPTAGPISDWVTIPHRGRSESLNVAMATTLLVFAAASSS